jgi:hypothetical protein
MKNAEAILDTNRECGLKVHAEKSKRTYIYVLFIYLVISEFTSRLISLLASSRASAFLFMILGWTESFCVFQMKIQSFF